MALALRRAVDLSFQRPGLQHPESRLPFPSGEVQPFPSRSTLAGQALAAWRSSLVKLQLVSPLQSHLLNSPSGTSGLDSMSVRPEPGERPSGALVKQVDPPEWGKRELLCGPWSSNPRFFSRRPRVDVFSLVSQLFLVG